MTEFRVKNEPVEVTSLSRPDPRWSYTDPAGHVHRWFVGYAPAPDAYDPTLAYHIPTAHVVETGRYVEDDGEETPILERRCLACQAPVVAGTAADTDRQYIPGIRRYYVDGRSVSRAEFARRAIDDLRSRGEAVPDWLQQQADQGGN